MTNLYLETAEPAAPAPRLDGDRRTDVVVVGGGFTGLSTALHLAERGTQVTVLEARQPGWGASGRNGGQVNPGLKYDPDVIEREFGPDLGGRMNMLSGAAPSRVFDLIDKHGIRCAARRNGTLRAAVGAKHAAKVRLTAAQWQRRGAPVELLEGPAVAAATGTMRYPAALWDKRGGDLNPLSYARGLARIAQRAGADLCGDTRALRVVADGDRWHVTTNSGTVSAGHVVLATNGYTDDLWPGLRRSVVPVFGAIAASAPMPPSMAQTVMPGRSALYESGAITVYYRVDGDGRLVFGGRGPQREISSTSPLGHLLAYAVRLWPQIDGLQWTHAWSGRLAMTRDQYPHVHEPARGVIACLGFNGRGVAMSTVMGAEIARRILDPNGSFDMPITTIKPIRMHAWWPLAVQGAIVRGRIADFLGL